MHRHELAGLGLALLARGMGTAEARPVPHRQAVDQQPARPHLVIVEGDGGFIIRCEMQQRLQGTQLPRGAIPPFAVPLGSSVRIDRAVLQHSNQKDISHGEPR